MTPKMCAAVPQKMWSCSASDRPIDSKAAIQALSSRLMCAMSQSEPHVNFRVETSPRRAKLSALYLFEALLTIALAVADPTGGD